MKERKPIAKFKIGTCLDCGRENVSISAGRCINFPYCNKKHRNSINSKKPAAIANKARKTNLNVFFGEQMLHIPANCENCHKSLDLSTSLDRRCVIAHILPKTPSGGFPDVATHPSNRMFLGKKNCNCHDQWDSNSDNRVKMDCYQLALDRYLKFAYLLSEHDQIRACTYLKCSQIIFKFMSGTTPGDKQIKS